LNNVMSFMIAQADPTGQDTAPPAAPPQQTQQNGQEAVTTVPGDAEIAERPPAPWWADSFFIPLLLGILILYIFVFRSKRTQDKKRQEMLTLLKKGERVQTIGGILGTVIEVRDNEVLLKVDESSNTKIRFARSAIHRVLEEEGK
jgi:preprotein translocase subunit YajC